MFDFFSLNNLLIIRVDQSKSSNIKRIFIFGGEYQIYFKCGEKTRSCHECIAHMKVQIFSLHKMEYIWYLPKNIIFECKMYMNNLTFSSVVFCLI